MLADTLLGFELPLTLENHAITMLTKKNANTMFPELKK